MYKKLISLSFPSVALLLRLLKSCNFLLSVCHFDQICYHSLPDVTLVRMFYET